MHSKKMRLGDAFYRTKRLALQIGIFCDGSATRKRGVDRCDSCCFRRNCSILLVSIDPDSRFFRTGGAASIESPSSSLVRAVHAPPADYELENVLEIEPNCAHRAICHHMPVINCMTLLVVPVVIYESGGYVRTKSCSSAGRSLIWVFFRRLICAFLCAESLTTVA